MLIVVCFLMEILFEETWCYNLLPTGQSDLMWCFVQANKSVGLNNGVQIQRNCDVVFQLETTYFVSV